MYLLAALIATANLTAAPEDSLILDAQVVFESEEEAAIYVDLEELGLQEIALDEMQEDFYADLEQEE